LDPESLGRQRIEENGVIAPHLDVVKNTAATQ
jgi:hypothetical protein